MDTGDNPWRDVAFDEALDFVHGLLGHRLHVTVESEPPVTLLRATGVLRAGRDMEQPRDHDEFVFELSAADGDSQFTLHRGWFTGALMNQTGRQISVFVGETGSASGKEPILWIFDLGPVEAPV